MCIRDRYKEEWLREVQLYDKVMISYQSRPGSRVKLYHKMKQGMREGLGYQSEILMPMYENLYVKQFVLYKDESINYYFQETNGKDTITTEKKELRNEREFPDIGKFGRLNGMALMGPANRRQAMLEFQEEEILADQMFKIY